jgi:tetratricopeptide (TPR) repeat protein
MRTVFADYNAATEAGHLWLTFNASQNDIAKAQLPPGDWAWLSDGEVVVGARLQVDERSGLVGVPDWETLVHLDDEDTRDYVKHLSEIQRLLGKSGDPVHEAKRVFELSTILEIVAPADVKAAFAPGFFSSRRAESLALLGKYELALMEIEHARRLNPDNPDDVYTYLEILRRIDLPRARLEAETLAPRLDIPAGILAQCVNVLATYSDLLADDQFEPVAEQILAWAGRFERAPGRERVLALIFALFQFNRGLVLLRLGRGDAAREALKLARDVDPIVPEIDEATRLTVYDQRARELAVRVRARPIAA